MCVVFTNGITFGISARVNRHIFMIWTSESRLVLREIKGDSSKIIAISESYMSVWSVQYSSKKRLTVKLNVYRCREVLPFPSFTTSIKSFSSKILLQHIG